MRGIVRRMGKRGLKRKIEGFQRVLAFLFGGVFGLSAGKEKPSIEEEEHRMGLSAFVFRGEDSPLPKRGAVLRPRLYKASMLLEPL